MPKINYRDKKQRLEKHKFDIKRTWAVINQLTGREKKKHTCLPQKLISDKKIITSETNICQEFNKYFVNVGPFLASNIAQPNKTFNNFLGEKPNTSINNENITKLEFNKAIIELKRNKSYRYDGISSNVAIYVIDSIRKPLFYLISSSFENSIFPDKLKLAKINPILKKGDCNNVSNYRPISLLPVFSKVYERSFDCDDLVLGVFIDLSKAFDTVDHSILLSKLKYYGIIGTTFTWIQSYFSNRKQFVLQEKSGALDITCGVPQGLILGP
ncbi:uncharacterized protein LOC136090003 [Hydra vulgaris]|uniref:Uncharacterized protein LOC136090003 n=1 Tax=Hydra vulgaris TaxID=6087 RepID=A0ABM4DCQ3_HYDVU